MSIAYAGTTGSLSGYIVDEHNKPVVGARVRAQSPTQVGDTISDAKGFFSFASLAPDMYTLTIEKTEYSPTSYAGVAIFADNAMELKFRVDHTLNVVIRDFFGPPPSLVKPNVTAQVYKARGVGFEGYPRPVMMTIATMPGLFVTSGEEPIR